MSIYTLEVDGVPIAACGNVSQDDAVSYFKSDRFLADLSGYQSAGAPGKPIYTEGSQLNVRLSFEEEIDIVRYALAQSVLTDTVGEDVPFATYLGELQLLEESEAVLDA